MTVFHGKIITVDSSNTIAGYLVEDGGRIVFSGSSDCPVTFPNGIEWIHRMVNNPNVPHRVDLANAIRVCTVNGYYNTFDDDLRGSLETGKIADMIILDKSPYDILRI